MLLSPWTISHLYCYTDTFVKNSDTGASRAALLWVRDYGPACREVRNKIPPLEVCKEMHVNFESGEHMSV